MMNKINDMIENKPYRMLARLGFGQPRISARNVPHLVLGKYSVCYFGKTKKFRVFYGYGDFSKPQTKIDFKFGHDVIAYLKGVSLNV